jgi:hypothetical protein
MPKQRGLITLSILLSLGIISCSDAWTKKFANAKAASEEHMIEKGWLPQFVPQDAADLVISGDLDSGIALGTFVSKDRQSFNKQCSSADDWSTVPDYALAWLSSNGVTGNSAALKRQGWEFLDCGPGNPGFVYSKSKSRFYYWMPRRK